MRGWYGRHRTKIPRFKAGKRRLSNHSAGDNFISAQRESVLLLLSKPGSLETKSSLMKKMRIVLNSLLLTWLIQCVESSCEMLGFPDMGCDNGEYCGYGEYGGYSQYGEYGG